MAIHINEEKFEQLDPALAEVMQQAFNKVMDTVQNITTKEVARMHMVDQVPPAYRMLVRKFVEDVLDDRDH